MGCEGVVHRDARVVRSVDRVQEHDGTLCRAEGLRQHGDLRSDAPLECLLVERGEYSVLALDEPALAFVDEQGGPPARFEASDHGYLLLRGRCPLIVEPGCPLWVTRATAC